MTWLSRAPLLLLLAVLPVALRADDAVERGVRQVQEGDFENAVVTLHDAATRLAGRPADARERGRALLHLGIAHVALDQMAEARAAFRDALRADPDLRPTTAEFSPKVVHTFDSARAELQAEGRVDSPKGGGIPAAAWIGIGGAAAAAGAIALAGGDDDGGDATFSNARFGTPVIVCPDGSVDVPIPVSILVDATVNATSVTVSDLTVTLVIVESAFLPEVGFASSSASSASPRTLPEGRSTLRVETTILCGNGVGDEPRFNVWTGRLTITAGPTSSTLQTVDRLRVNVP